jgi:general secretion pathway protein A
MYRQFFGFKEKPFNLVPNPAFLFLSKSHEEAMAHLNYAISQGDGFVVLTGEVGTGKTTLCRAFLESLKDDTEVAYIFNPGLDALQLLKAINDELAISSTADNTKDLIDTLNTFLLEKSMADQKVILLIDEAQNLSSEVLEQLRLLSNLETTTRKLLQIILVGQPELSEHLCSYELRQLEQRITLNCHIRPLNFTETREYIHHRLHVASDQCGPRFEPAAFRRIYRYSGGIPRLINIVCDRMLLTAFVLNRSTISGRIARRAIDELRGRDTADGVWADSLPNPFFTGVMLIILVLGGIVFYLHSQGIWPVVQRPDDVTLSTENPAIATSSDRQRVLPPERSRTAGIEAASTTGPAAAAASVLDKILIPLDGSVSRVSALNDVLCLWKKTVDLPAALDNIQDDQDFFRQAAQEKGLDVFTVENDFVLLERLNLPAILQFYSPSKNSTVYLALTRRLGKQWRFIGGSPENSVDVDEDKILPYWTGIAYVPWKNYLPGTRIISVNQTGDEVAALKRLLRDIGFDDITMDAKYDAAAVEAVKSVQRKYRITVDGVVGPMTRIVLFNEQSTWAVPHLAS